MPLVFTNGVFDILHRGHVQYLTQAAELGRLVVGLNSDASTRALKPGRPVNCEYDRKVVLKALRCVSQVIIFDAPTPMDLIRSLKPDIYVKGGDYDMDALPEAALVRSWGGKALAMPYLAGYSTSRLL